MGWKATTIEAARRLGVLPLIGAYYGRRRLTVLAYHRIADAGDPKLEGFAGNVSAGPDAFGAQLDWMARRFEIVSLDDVVACLGDGADLPDRAAVITFDDGYRDNLDRAAPLLAERDLPAALFLTTGPTDGGPALHWDLVAWIIEHGRRRSGQLPGLGHRDWGRLADRRRVVHEAVYATKWLPLEQRIAFVDALRESVDGPDGDQIPGLYLDWDGVRALDGWTIGAHTIRHPVLTSVTQDEAAAEIAGSAERIRAETGQPVRTLAYPNGLEGDYDAGVAALARRAGIEVAFTLQPGPSRMSEARDDPMTVRRVYVGFNDGLGVVAGKAMGVSRLLGSER